MNRRTSVILSITFTCMLSFLSQAVASELWIGAPGSNECQRLEKSMDDVEFRSPELGHPLVSTTNGGHKIVLLGSEAIGTRSIVSPDYGFCVAALRFANLPVNGYAWMASTNGGNISSYNGFSMQSASLSALALSVLKAFSYSEDVDGAFTFYNNDTIVIKKINRDISKEKVIIALDLAACEQGVKLATQPFLQPIYNRQYDSLSSAESMERFVADWSKNDFESLVPGVELRLKSMKVNEYENDYRAATSYESMRKFLDKYRNDDSKGYLKIISAKIDFTRAEQDIRYCIEARRDAEKSIQREKEIAKVSGYVNSLVLRRAGEIIVSCKKSIPVDYENYRKQGGKKSLSELQ